MYAGSTSIVCEFLAGFQTQGLLHLMGSRLSLYTGHQESAEASHLDGYNYHSHFWNMLGT